MAVARQSNERLFCWEQVARVNPLFRVSQPFAPAGQAERLLPLYALFSAVEQLCTQWSDAELARRKLDWWRSECLAGDPANSDHPILRELAKHSALPDRGLLGPLLEGAAGRLDGVAPADGDGLEALCRETGLPQVRIELDALGEDPGGALATAPSARIGLAQLLRESMGQGRPNHFWWLPLNLLARHGISRAEVEQEVDGPVALALFSEILDQAGRWKQPIVAAENSLPQAARHLAVHAHLQQRALDRLRGRPPSEYATALRKAGLAELLQAWRCARRVSRP